MLLFANLQQVFQTRLKVWFIICLCANISPAYLQWRIH